MPLPLIIGGIALVASITGVGTGIHGGIKMKGANATMKEAKLMQESAVNDFEKKNVSTTEIMDKLGNQELELLESFEGFSDLIEQIQGRPEFKEYSKDGIDLPKYEAEELKKISAGASILISGMSGAALGTAGGFAAAGATTSAVMALGTASTGTAIVALHGAAATNATLAALGGGAVVAGGGGMALGSTILGGATLGVGLLVSGVILNVTGMKLSDKADEAYSQAQRTRAEVDKIIEYLEELSRAASEFIESLSEVDRTYRKHLASLDQIVNCNKKTKWNDFTEDEKRITENIVLLVGLLYKMCQVKLVLVNDEDPENMIVNDDEISRKINEAENVLKLIGENTLS